MDFVEQVQNAEAEPQDKINERIEKIHKIKQFTSPPYKSDDAYYEREPWDKFGGVSSGICVGWSWYNDKHILQNATDADIDLAISEMRKSDYDI